MFKGELRIIRVDTKTSVVALHFLLVAFASAYLKLLEGYRETNIFFRKLLREVLREFTVR